MRHTVRGSRCGSPGGAFVMHVDKVRDEIPRVNERPAAAVTAPTRHGSSPPLALFWDDGRMSETPRDAMVVVEQLQKLYAMQQRARDCFAANRDPAVLNVLGYVLGYPDGVAPATIPERLAAVEDRLAALES